MNIILRDIQDRDLEKIMHWRINPEITRYMKTNPKLTIEKQREWLAKINNSNDSKYWIIDYEEESIGIICLEKIDWINKVASWGYYIGEKEKRSLQLAISLEMSLYDYVFDELEIKELCNQVFSLNKGVIQLHLACGSHIVKEVKNEVEKEGVLYDITHISITSEEWSKIRENKKYQKIEFDIKFVPHHIGIAVADLKATLIQYKKIGYETVDSIYTDEIRNINIAFVKNGNILLELIEPLNDESPVTRMLLDRKNVSIPYHICYVVENLEVAIYVMRKRGYTITKYPQEAIALGGRRVAFMINKEVGLIELLESQ